MITPTDDQVEAARKIAEVLGFSYDDLPDERAAEYTSFTKGDFLEAAQVTNRQTTPHEDIWDRRPMLVWGFRNGASYQQANPDEPIGSIRHAAEQWADSLKKNSVQELNEDAVLALLRKHFDTKTRHQLTYDGGEERVSGSMMQFVESIRAAFSLAPAGKDVGVEQLADLVRNAQALLDLDAKGVLVPHGIGGLAREIIAKFIAISALVSQPHPEGEAPFQQRVGKWMPACFTPDVCADKLERGDRLLEETFELLQSDDYPEERVDALKAYTFARPKGEPHQEVGGVMVTLAAYCLAHGLDMHQAGEDELARIWTKIDKIRAKQAAKPTGSALPIALHPAPHKAGNEGLVEAARLAEAMRQVLLLLDLFEASERTHKDAYYLLAQQPTTWEFARTALAALLAKQEGGK